MSRRLKLALLLGFIVATLVLVTCQPIDYYLARVYKVYGKVTYATWAGEAGPLESVEVSIHGTQISVLTNGQGDYELMVPEGTWTVDFNGPAQSYKPFSASVTVGPKIPKVNLDMLLSMWPFGGLWQFIDVNRNLEFGAQLQLNEYSTYWFYDYGSAYEPPSSGLQGTVLTITNSRFEVRLTGAYGPETDPYNAMIALFYKAGLGDGVNKIYFPYSYSSAADQLTVTVPVEGALETVVFNHTAPQ